MSLLLHVTLQSKPNAPPRLLQNFQNFTRETEPTTLSNLFRWERVVGSGDRAAPLPRALPGGGAGASNREVFPSGRCRSTCRNRCRTAGRNRFGRMLGGSFGTALGTRSSVAPDTEPTSRRQLLDQCRQQMEQRRRSSGAALRRWLRRISSSSPSLKSGRESPVRQPRRARR